MNVTGTLRVDNNSLYLDDERVDDVLLGEEPMSHVLLSHRWSKMETSQVFLQQLGNLVDVTPLHRPQTCSLGALCVRRKASVLVSFTQRKKKRRLWTDK